jgi:hypothetical protein
MSKANPKKQKKTPASSGYETMLARVVARAADITSGRATLSLIAAARVKGLVAPPPHSRAYINDAYAGELARRAENKRRRGFNIIMLGRPTDPMQRPGTEPVFRGQHVQWAGSSPSSTAPPQASSGKPAPTSAAPTPKAPEPLMTKDGDVLEEVEDEPTPCRRCRGRKYVVDDLRERHICPACEGHGIVLL